MSTDNQSADSPADQVARCRDFAIARGWRVVEDLVGIDSGISGASRHNRPALLELFERIAEWDVLLVWDASRLARNVEDAGWVMNQLEEHGRSGYAVSTGQPLDSLGEQIMGVMSAEERKKISARTSGCAAASIASSPPAARPSATATRRSAA